MPHSLQDLSFLTRDPAQTTAVKATSPNLWIARELPATVGFLRDFHAVFSEGQKGRKPLFPSPREEAWKTQTPDRGQPSEQAFSLKEGFEVEQNCVVLAPHVLLLPLVCGKPFAKE